MLFPRYIPEEEADGASPVGYQAQAVEGVARAPLILVVDDGREIAEMARESLVETGYRVAVALSADEAIRAFDEAAASGDAFDLVFSDVLMPGGANGLVLAEQVRERSPGTPVILTTGYNDEMSIDGPQTVAMEVLGKPYKRTELIGRVQAGLRRGARTGPSRETSDFGHAQA